MRRGYGIILRVDLSVEMPDGEVGLSGGARLELVPADGDYASAILRREPDGSVAWRALPPDGRRDAWVSVRLQEEAVVANSWSCWLVRLDLTTGAVIERIFTK
jgi:hypothetical protein